MTLETISLFGVGLLSRHNCDQLIHTNLWFQSLQLYYILWKNAIHSKCCVVSNNNKITQNTEFNMKTCTCCASFVTVCVCA